MSIPVPEAPGPARATAFISSSPQPQPRSAIAWPGPRLILSSSRSACSADSGAFHRIRAYNAASGS